MSWLTYTVGYVFSMFAFSGAETIVASPDWLLCLQLHIEKNEAYRYMYSLLALPLLVVDI